MSFGNIQLKATKDSPPIFGPLTLQIHPHQFIAIVSDTDTPVTSIYQVLLGYLKPSEGRIDFEYTLSEHQKTAVSVMTANNQTSHHYSGDKVRAKMDSSSAFNLRGQIYYAESHFSIFNTSIRENLFPKMNKMMEDYYMKIYEFLIKYQFNYEGFKDKGFETHLEEYMITPEERKLLFLAQLMMNRANLILLNSVETGMTPQVIEALDEILLELS